MDLRKYHELSEWFGGKIAGAFSAFDMQAIDTGCKRLIAGDCYVEIGTQNGRSAYCADQFLPKGVNCFAVDIFDAPTGPDTMSRKDFFKEYLPDWRFIHAPSELASKGFPLAIDMIFIDADHSYDAVKLDVESWYPHVKNGGYLYFHDADSGDVLKLMDEMEQDPRFTLRVNYKEIQQNNTGIVSFRKGDNDYQTK